MIGLTSMRQQRRHQLTSAMIALTLGCLFLASASLAFAPTADERIWQQFSEWLSTTPPTERSASIFEQYRAHLLALGGSPADAAEQLAVIRQMLRTRTDGWRILFNTIYLSPTPRFNINPNALLVSAVERRPPGRALDVAMGQGRNAVFLAIKGWDVTGFDVADEGLRIAQRNAERAGVKLNAVLQSDGDFDFGTARWDLVVITYAPVPLTTENYVKKLRNALRSGGIVVIESFASDSASLKRGLVDIDPSELRRAFAGLHIVHFEDTFAIPDWGHVQTRVARLIAEKAD